MNPYALVLGGIVVGGVVFLGCRAMDLGYELSAGGSLTSLNLQVTLTKAAA